MELFVWVKKTFDQLFHVQEKLKVFQVYDHSKAATTDFDWQEAFGTALKEATWVTFMSHFFLFEVEQIDNFSK